MTHPLRATCALSAEAYRQLRLKAIFDCGKWDPQIGDVSTLCPFALQMDEATCRQLGDWSRRMASEVTEAEVELLDRPPLLGELGLPRAVSRLLRRRRGPLSPAAARVMRFDFHPTLEGWRITESNTDVPGGYLEAGAISRLMAEQLGEGAFTDDPADRLAAAIGRALADAGRSGGHVAVLHATAYTDDVQVARHLAAYLTRHGMRSTLASPAHLHWREGRARLCAAVGGGAVDLVLRFFPGEWLSNLPRHCGWSQCLVGGRTPLSNPGWTLVSQSKRFPLIWPRLRSTLPTWAALMPETRDPRDVPRRDRHAWVYKPALGRVGEGVTVHGVSSERQWRRRLRKAWLWHGAWAAQRRLTSLPLATPLGPMHACIGVYTVDGEPAGIYGRVSPRPLIDDKAMDVAVLLDRPKAAVVPAAPARSPGPAVTIQERN